MATRKISFSWEGELDDESLEQFQNDPVTCLEFLDNSDKTKITITEGDKVLFEDSLE